jgi:hypothetical protein
MVSSFGVKSVSYELTTSVDVDLSSDTKVLIDKNGYFVEAYTSDSSYKVTVKGHGDDAPMDITAFGTKTTSGIPSTISGSMLVQSVKSTQTNEDWVTWEYSGTVYPYLQDP